MDNLSGEYSGKASTAGNSLERMSKDAGKKIGTIASDFANSTTEYVKSGREYVAENPATGVAIAAAAGAVVGSLITLGMRRSKH